MQAGVGGFAHAKGGKACTQAQVISRASATHCRHPDYDPEVKAISLRDDSVCLGRRGNGPPDLVDAPLMPVRSTGTRSVHQRKGNLFGGARACKLGGKALAKPSMKGKTKLRRSKPIAAAVFLRNNATASPSSRSGGKVRLSRSPDLRISSRRTAFSSKCSMTDFRHVRGLHAYSGGTVPESHRIIYSLLSLFASQQHLNVIYFVW